jgi:hypothetical protein
MVDVYMANSIHSAHVWPKDNSKPFLMSTGFSYYWAAKIVCRRINF